MNICSCTSHQTGGLQGHAGAEGRPVDIHRNTVHRQPTAQGDVAVQLWPRASHTEPHGRHDPQHDVTVHRTCPGEERRQILCEPGESIRERDTHTESRRSM